MIARCSLIFLMLASFLPWSNRCLGAEDAVSASSIRWKTISLDPRFRSEGVAVADVNQDGRLDVLAGEFWYEAPKWTAHELAPPGDYGDGSSSYSNNFACFADDINDDDWTDLVVVGFPGKPCHWFENPKNQKRYWPKHEIWPSACNETPLYTDLFGNDQKVLIMGWQPAGQDNQGQMAWFLPGKDPSLPWEMHPLSRPSQPDAPIPGTQRFSHGLGVGDVNDDHRPDVIITAGWWEQPTELSDHPWPFHPATLGPRCANLYTDDVNGDGTADVLSSSAHEYGIWWHQQSTNDDPVRTFIRHDLFADLVSQTHALEYADINGDGLRDLITGKRWWAHGPSGDPGSDQPAVLYWFEAKRDAQGMLSFVPRLVHNESGIGTQFQVTDINRDDLLDIITSNKRGVYVHLQLR